MNRTPIFDAVRDMLGRGFKAKEIAALDRAIDAGLANEITVIAPIPPINSEEFDSAVIGHLRFEEGVRPNAYKDHLGWWTIGIGRLIDPRKGGRITPEEDAILLANDPSRKGKSWRQYTLTEAEMNMLKANDVARFVKVISKWPVWKAVGDNVARQVALTSMAFQLGTDGLAGFPNSLRLVERGKYVEAADSFLKSLWAKQTPERAKRVTDMIRTGRL